VAANGVTYGFGANTRNNAMSANGQTIAIPDGAWDRLYLLAASSGGLEPITIEIDGVAASFEVQAWSGFIGQPDFRIWNTNSFPEITYDWDGAMVGVAPGYLCKDPIAWTVSRRHSPEGAIEYYDRAYVFRYALPLPAGAKNVTFPVRKRVMLFAASVASNSVESTVPVSPDLGVT
jgi:alpha-mannosidase